MNIYLLWYKYIIDEMWVSEEILKRHLTPNWTKDSSLSDIFQQMVFSIQNNAQKRNYFKMLLGSIDKLDEILSEFEPHAVVKKYNINLLDISTSIDLLMKDIDTKRWPVENMSKKWFLYWFCKWIIEWAYILSQFTNADEFYNKIQSYIDEKNKEWAIDWLSPQVHWLGEATTSDFLKEIWYTAFWKLDTHIKNTMIWLWFASEDMKDRDIMNVFYDYADSISISAYALDKVIYMIWSWEVYIDDKRVQYPKSRDKFITYCLEHN